MISVSLIERSLDSKDHDRLIRELSDNGLNLPLSLRMVLADSESAVSGLSLRRLVDLTYGPTALSKRLDETLFASQDEEGRFVESDSSQSDPLVLAAALSGLAHQHLEHLSSQNDDRLSSALERGFAALARHQDCDGLFSSNRDRTLGDRALTTAFVVRLLGVHPRFRSAVRIFDLRDWFETNEHRLDRQAREFWELASVTLLDLPQPARETIAAA